MLQVAVNRGTKLLNVEEVSKSDPFCMLWVGDVRKRTKMIANDLDPIWNEKYDIMLKDKVRARAAQSVQSTADAVCAARASRAVM